MSHPPEYIHGLWLEKENADIVIASRYVKGGYADQPLFRLALSKVLNLFFRFGLSIPVGDMSSGYRLYNRRIFDAIELEFVNFVILIEILAKCYYKRFKIKEVPFHYKPRESGVSKARIIEFGKDYLRLFLLMWRTERGIGNGCL